MVNIYFPHHTYAILEISLNEILRYLNPL